MRSRRLMLLCLCLAPASAFAQFAAENFAGVGYDEGLRLTEEQVRACQEIVRPLHPSDDDLRYACGEEGDNIGRGTISVRIVAGQAFAGCVRGLQRLYRQHAPRANRHFGAPEGPVPYAFLVNCAYINTTGRRMVATDNGSFERCAFGPITRGAVPTGISSRIRRCVTPSHYRVDAAFDGMAPRARASASDGEARGDPADSAGD